MTLRDGAFPRYLQNNGIPYRYEPNNDSFNIDSYDLSGGFKGIDAEACIILKECKVVLSCETRLSNESNAKYTEHHEDSFDITCDLPHNQRAIISFHLKNNDVYAGMELITRGKEDNERTAGFIVSAARTFVKTVIQEVNFQSDSLYFRFIEGEYIRYQAFLANAG
jgi:hypothetical protein